MSSVAKGAKYVKRGDLEKQRQEAYWKEQQEKERQRLLKRGISAVEEKEPEDQKVEKTTVSSKDTDPSSIVLEDTPASHALSALKEEDDDEEWKNIKMEEEELVKRFRARNQPIRLFGETYVDRLKRLKRIESTEERTEGQRNDFRDLLQAADRDIADRILRGSDKDQQQDFTDRKKKQRLAELDSVDTSIISIELLNEDKDKNCQLMVIYLKRMLREWETFLDARSDDEKRTVQGKLASATQAQAGEYLKPFFKSLKRKELPDDVIARITEICYWMQRREYMKANDSYLQLSIGNAPWPIGVTMVGKNISKYLEGIGTNELMRN